MESASLNNISEFFLKEEFAYQTSPITAVSQMLTAGTPSPTQNFCRSELLYATIAGH